MKKEFLKQNKGITLIALVITIVILIILATMGQSEVFTSQYVVEVIVCDGVTDIGVGAFYLMREINKVTINKDVTNIGDYAFYGCSSLSNITIPNSVTSTGINAFYGCEKLAIIKILVTDTSNFSIGSGVAWENAPFRHMADNAIIYVLSEDLKTKLYGQYDETVKTIQVVTLDEMNNL